MTILLTILLFVSDLIETTYDLGAFTRQHILPAVVYLYCIMEWGWDQLTSMESRMKIHNTPMATGFAYGM